MPEELTTKRDDDEAFAALLKQAATPPALVPLPPGLSERIAAATYARPTLWQQLALVLRPAPARFALGSALTAAALCVVVVPRLSKPTAPQLRSAGQEKPLASEPTEVVPSVEQATKPSVDTPAPDLSTPDSAPVLPKATVHVVGTKRSTARSEVVATPPVTKRNPSPSTPPVAPRTSILKDHAVVAVDTSKSPEAPSTTATSTLPEPAAQAGTTAVATRVASGGEAAVLTDAEPTLAAPVIQTRRPRRTEVALSEDTTNNRVHLSVTNDEMSAAQGGFKSLRNSQTTAYRPGTQLSLLNNPVQ